MEEVLEFLNTIHPLSEKLKSQLRKVVQLKKIKRKDHLLLKGQTCNTIGFIMSGLMRCYYVKDGNEVCSWFMKEGDVITSVDSYFGDQPGEEYIQALQDTYLYYITKADLNDIYNRFIEFNYNGRVLTERYYRLSERRAFSLRMHTAHERYQFLLKHHAELIIRVPNKYLASYLGMDASTLSRAKRSS